MTYRILLCLCLMTLWACGGSDEAVHPDDKSNPAMAADNTQGEAVSDPYADYFEDGSYIIRNSHANVVRNVEFFGTSEDNTAEGFNLDDLVSKIDDEKTCGHGDLSDESGRAGIDNQVAVIWTDLLGPLVGEATHALMKGAINEGRLLLGIELSGVDDLKNDDDITLTFFRARTGDPHVGTLGLLAPDQTYYVDSEFPKTVIENLQIKDGEVMAGPVEFQSPIDVLAEFFIVKVTQGRLRFKIAEDGTFTGLIGGVINVADVLEEGYKTNAAQEFRAVTPFFLDNTDMMLNADGGCDGISMAIRFEATTGFVVHQTDDDQPQASK